MYVNAGQWKIVICLFQQIYETKNKNGTNIGKNPKYALILYFKKL